MDKDSKLIFEAHTQGQKVPRHGVAMSDLVWSDINEELYPPKEFIMHLDEQPIFDIEDLELEREPEAPHGYTCHPALYYQGDNLGHFDCSGKLFLDIRKGDTVELTKALKNEHGEQLYTIKTPDYSNDNDVRTNRYTDIQAPEDKILQHFDFSSSGQARSTLRRLR